MRHHSAIDKYEDFLYEGLEPYLRGFKIHVANGWSPSSFAGKLPNSTYYYKLMKDSKEWRSVSDGYKKRRANLSVYWKNDEEVYKQTGEKYD